MQTEKGADSIIDCKIDPVPCPARQGYGLGFNVLDYGNRLILEHGGSDWSEVALVYIDKPSRSEAILFLNAPNAKALAAMPELIALIDPASPFLPEYRRWLA